MFSGCVTVRLETALDATHDVTGGSVADVITSAAWRKEFQRIPLGRRSHRWRRTVSVCLSDPKYRLV